MSECDLDTSVPDWVIDHPETLTVFQELGIASHTTPKEKQVRQEHDQA